MCVRAFCVLLFRISRTWFLRGAALVVLICCIGIAVAQVELPEVVVRAAKPKPQPKQIATARPAPAAHVRPHPASPTRYATPRCRPSRSRTCGARARLIRPQNAADARKGARPLTVFAGMSTFA
jgi:hypothetical protein